MGPTHNGDARFPEDIRDSFHFLAERTVTAVVAAADAEVDRIRLHDEDPLYFFIEPLIFPREMAAAAAFHKGPHLEGLIPVGGETVGPSVESSEAPCAGADVFRLRTGEKDDGFHRPAFLAMASASFQCFGM